MHVFCCSLTRVKLFRLNIYYSIYLSTTHYRVDDFDTRQLFDHYTRIWEALVLKSWLEHLIFDLIICVHVSSGGLQICIIFYCLVFLTFLFFQLFWFVFSSSFNSFDIPDGVCVKCVYVADLKPFRQPSRRTSLNKLLNNISDQT